MTYEREASDSFENSRDRPYETRDDAYYESATDGRYAARRRPQREDGIQIDLPFVSFRLGRGEMSWPAAMSEDDAYERARLRVQARLSFYRHLTIYFAVMAAIVFIDLVTGGGLANVTLWIAGIWGALLVWQVFNVFVFPFFWSQETEERMIQDELRRQRER